MPPLRWTRRRLPRSVDGLLWAIEDADALVALGALDELLQLLPSLDRELITLARRQGHTWTRIAEARGFKSRQTIHAHARRLGAAGTLASALKAERFRIRTGEWPGPPAQVLELSRPAPTRGAPVERLDLRADVR